MTKFLRPGSWSRLFGGRTENNAATAAVHNEEANGIEVVTEVPPRSSNEVDFNFLVEQRAYFLWRDDGCPGGRDIYYWLRAEEEIQAELASGTLVRR